MGNYRFRLSDMIPNAWFYKLKDMGKKPKPKPRTQNNSKKPKPQQQQQQQQQQLIQHRNSYYFTSNEPYFKPSTIDRLYNSPTNPKFSDVHFPESPRKSSKRRPRRRPNKPNSSKPITSSMSAGCSCKASIDSSAKTDSTPDSSSSSSSPDPNLYSEPVSSWSSSSSCKLSSSATDIIIDVERLETKKNFGLDSISEIELPPILTKPVQKNQIHCPKISPRSYLISPKLKLRTNSPKIRANSPRIRANRKPAAAKNYTNTTTLTRRKKHVLESFAIVKSSFDPQRDFRDSMVEMIVENNLRASKDLEELLACYLSLNSNEYHDLIVKVFEQIWFDLIDVQM